MTRVDFYILPQREESERHNFACRLVEKAYKMGHQIYVHAPDKESAAAMDERLWCYRRESFTPHNLIGDRDSHPSSVEIGYATDPEEHHDVLINLAAEVPQFFSRFSRVAEVVSSQTEALSSSRQRFSFYRDRGYPLNTHDLRKK